MRRMKFTQEQVNAIYKMNGPVQILACPGSGKTTTIVGKVGVLRQRYPNDHVLVTTFSEKAAREMKEKYDSYFGEDVCITWCTLHSLAYQIAINKYHNRLYSIITEDEIEKCFYERMKGRYSEGIIKHVIQHITNIVYEIRLSGSPHYETEEDKEKYGSVYAEAVPYYIAYKKATLRKDYNDMVFDAIDVLKDVEILKRWQQRYQFIIVDEAQDMDPFQARICYALAQKHRNICIVGDDDQSIYAFRGAGISTFQNFADSFPEYCSFDLGKNFRSPEAIVIASQKLISNNKKRMNKKIESANGNLGGVDVQCFAKFSDQTAFIIKQIKELITDGESPENIAVLYRTKRANEQVAALLYEQGIEFHTSERMVDYHSNVFFQDILAYWRIANGEEKVGDVERIINKPNRGAKQSKFLSLSYKKLMEVDLDENEDRAFVTAVKKLKNDIASLEKCKSNKTFINTLMRDVGYINWVDQYIGQSENNFIYLEQIFETILHQSRMFPTIDIWISHVYDYRKIAGQSVQSQKGVALLTFHAAKGLEWDYVFVINAIEGQTPLNRVIQSGGDEEIEEERRIFYVAITRAKKHLFVTCVKNKKMKPSRFIMEMGKQI